MKFCKNCSASLEDDAVFCTECGISLADDDFSSVKSTDSRNDSFASNENSQTLYNAEFTQASYTSSSQQQNTVKKNNPGVPWMIVSIVLMFCCINICMIPSLIISLQSMSSFNAGNIEESNRKAKIAMTLAIIGIVVGTILNFILIISYFTNNVYGSVYY